MTRQERYDLINELGRYAPTPEELFDRVGDILSRSYGEEAARKICASWSRKAALKGYTAVNRQLRLF